MTFYTIQFSLEAIKTTLSDFESKTFPYNDSFKNYTHITRESWYPHVEKYRDIWMLYYRNKNKLTKQERQIIENIRNDILKKIHTLNKRYPSNIAKVIDYLFCCCFCGYGCGSGRQIYCGIEEESTPTEELTPTSSVTVPLIMICTPVPKVSPANGFSIVNIGSDLSSYSLFNLI